MGGDQELERADSWEGRQSFSFGFRALLVFMSHLSVTLTGQVNVLH